jgi:hypothetical protein
MKKQVLFTHGGGEGAYEEDKKMAANLLVPVPAEFFDG